MAVTWDVPFAASYGEMNKFELHVVASDLALVRLDYGVACSYR